MLLIRFNNLYSIMKFPLLIIFLCFALSVFGQKAKGVVFEDSNQNGLRESTEPGLAKVAVSNGVQVVLTDEQGFYELPIHDDQIIFVIKPSGFHPPVNEALLPQFYYLHKPNGSPILSYPGVPPTGPLPRSIDFPLIKAAESDTFKVLYFGDPQTYNQEQVDYFTRDIVAGLMGVNGYAFGVTMGDIVGDDLDLFNPINDAISQIGIPWYNVYGNHDMNTDATYDSLADETFEAVYGPATYSFNYGKVHFVVMDDVIYPRDDGKPGYIGGFREDQLAFLENDLKYVDKNMLVVVQFHIPLFLEAYFGETFRKRDRDRFFALLKDFPFTLSISAHTHTQNHFDYDHTDGWQGEKSHHHYNVGTASGDWWTGVKDDEGIPLATMRDGTPNGYMMMTFQGNEYRYEYQAAREPADFKIRLHAPKSVRRNSRNAWELYANFFQGSDSSKLNYRIDGGAWKPMWHMKEHDPSVTDTRSMWDNAPYPPEGTRPSNPVNSAHLWKIRLPTRLSPGVHRIEVQAIDRFGRKYFAQTTYRVVRDE